MKYSEIKFNRTVKCLYDAIIKVVLEHPIKDITVEMVLQEAQIARQTFYKYFEDKYALINYVYYHDTADLAKDLYKSKEIFLENGMKKLTILQNKKDFYKRIASYEGQNSFSEFYYQYYTTYWENFLIAYYGKEFYNEELKYEFFVKQNGNIAGTLHWIRENCQNIAPREKMEIAFDNLPDFLKKAIEDPDKNVGNFFNSY